MTPIYDQLLWEYIDREDTTFETYHGTSETKIELPGSCTRSEILHTISIRQKEAVSCSEPISILISKTPLPDSETERSSGAGSAPVNLELPRPTTLNGKHPETSMLSLLPRSETPLTGRKSLLNTELVRLLKLLRMEYLLSTLGTISESTEMSEGLSSYSTNRGWLVVEIGSPSSSRSHRVTTGSSLVPLQETHGWIISQCLLQMGSTRIALNSSGTMLSIIRSASSRKWRVTPASHTWSSYETRSWWRCLTLRTRFIIPRSWKSSMTKSSLTRW